jgi:alpha-glucosidase
MRFGGGKYPHERYHNQYGFLMAMATTAGLMNAMPGRRTFVLTRAAFAGIQRYAASWLGDNQSRWDHLRVSLPMAMGFGVSGQPFVGADVGGFQGSCNAELFLRWMQYGTLTPFCRNHSEIGNVDQYPWAWGDVIQDLVREAVRLRYRLLPYLYAAFIHASRTGAPVQRPLVFDYQYDPTVRDIDDECLLGPDLLVAPVLAAGATARNVYLPPGGWYDWHTDELLPGRRYVLAATPVERIPIYARAGAVVPMWPHAPASTAGYHPSAIELHLFVPDAEGTYLSFLQEDDGLTFAAMEGACYRTTFQVARASNHVTLRADVVGGGYPEFARNAFHLVVHGAHLDTVRVNESMVAISGDRFVVPNAGSGFTVEFEV